jgi:hypothetical protein
MNNLLEPATTQYPENWSDQQKTRYEQFMRAEKLRAEQAQKTPNNPHEKNGQSTNTPAKAKLFRRRKEHVMPYEERWLEALLQDGKLPGQADEQPDRATTEKLLRDLQRRIPKMKYTTKMALATFLHDIGCTPWRKTWERGWQFPPLAEARASFERLHGGAWPWREPARTEWRRDPRPAY